MSYASVDSAIIQRLIRNCSDTLSRIEKTKQSLTNKYQALGATWSDAKYQQLGTIVSDCNSAISKVSGELQGCVQKLEMLNVHIKEYESVNFDGGGGGGNSGETGFLGRLFGRNQRTGGASSGGTASQGSGQPAPRSLTQTAQTWQENADGSQTFNAPVETGRTLNSNQGNVDGFRGTCGLVSCSNVLSLAGVNVPEAEIVEFASTTRNAADSAFLCTTGRARAGANGGTSYRDRQEILAHYGLTTETRPATTDNIYSAVTEGRGVIVSVNAGQLYNGASVVDDLHAIVITSARVHNGEVQGFYTCDSNNRPSRFYTTQQIQDALSGRPLNVTSSIIR